MSNIREGLVELATAIETLQNQPAPRPQILDRSLSGDKIMGGKISRFSSVGIKDNATFAEREVLFVENDRIIAPAIETPTITNPLTVQGNLTVQGEISATRLHVDEVSADVRNERTSNLEFKAQNGRVANKGLVWTGEGNTKQLTLQNGEDGYKLFASENIDVARGREYKIGGQTVVSTDSLGIGVKNSSLTTVGTLRRLQVAESFTVDNYLHYDPNTSRLGLGTLEPNAALSIKSLDHEFVIDEADNLDFKVGTWTTTGLQIVTDDTRRISISPTGVITVHEKTIFNSPIGIGVRNPTDDVSITTVGPVRFQNKKQEVASAIPVSGSYRKGDIVWNNDPKPTGFVGWVCIADGSPGTWKGFGSIAR